MAVGLKLAGKNDFVRVQEDINDNLTKLDEAIDFNLLATLGIEYGGILNNTNAKVSGKAYYDTTGKKLYKCIANTSINYADAGFFEALSNNDLLTNSKFETTTIYENVAVFTNSILKITKHENKFETNYTATYDLTQESLGAGSVYNFDSKLKIHTTVPADSFSYVARIADNKIGKVSNSGEKIVFNIDAEKLRNVTMLIVATARVFRK